MRLLLLLPGLNQPGAQLLQSEYVSRKKQNPKRKIRTGPEFLRFTGVNFLKKKKRKTRDKILARAKTFYTTTGIRVGQWLLVCAGCLVGQKEGVRVGVCDGFKIDFEPSGDVFE